MVCIAERPPDHALAILRRRVEQGLNPFFCHSDTGEALRALDSVAAPASDAWAAAFLELGRAWAGRAEELAAAGREPALDAWRLAYDYCHIARYPHADTELKRAAHASATAFFGRAAEYVEAIEPVRIACSAGTIPAILQRPPEPGRVPAIACVGGLDVWKEEVISVVAKPYLAAGWAVLALDGPGTGDSPYPASADADAMWDPVLDWMDARSDLLPGARDSRHEPRRLLGDASGVHPRAAPARRDQPRRPGALHVSARVVRSLGRSRRVPRRVRRGVSDDHPLGRWARARRPPAGAVAAGRRAARTAECAAASSSTGATTRRSTRATWICCS